MSPSYSTRVRAPVRRATVRSAADPLNQRLRRAVIKFSILWVDEPLSDLKLRSMHYPEKKDSTTSAIAEGAIVGRSASIFMARRRCCSPRFSVMTPSGRIANSRIELTEKHPLLFPHVQSAILKERLDVLPTERLLSEAVTLQDSHRASIESGSGALKPMYALCDP